MLDGSANETAIDGRTMSVEDAHCGSSLGGSMDVRKIIAFIGAFYWIVMTVLIVPGAVVASFFTIMLPAMLIWIPLHNWIDHKLCRMVNDHWVSASQSAGLNVIEYGDDISEIAEKRVLFLSNHLGLVDHFVLMCAMYNKGTIAEKYLWVIFNIWKMTPLGAMWLTHGNYFINGGASQRERLLKQFREHLKDNYWKFDHRWIVMYPEGSRLYLIRESNARYAKRIGEKVFRNCALPRSSGAHAVFEIAGKSYDNNNMELNLARCGLGGPVEYVVDCTLGYYKGDVPELGRYMTGEFPHKQSTVGVHYKIYPVKAEWSDEEKLRQWLYARYEEKDELLEYYYTKGTFPVNAKSRPRPLHFPFSRCVVVETFWILLFYAHYHIWVKPLCIFLLNIVLSVFI
uniref:Phospholipid/glycerol acyltransferase domain-containing protein n=1 Tax=Parascaris univalens TaxID=6257 RepID=A0A915A811_PARUN